MQQAMGRRRVLAGMMVILALVTGTFGGGQVARAQYLVLFEDVPYADLTGAEEASHRLYQGAPAVNIHALIVRFDSEPHAELGQTTLDGWLLDAFATAPSPLAFEPVDATGASFVNRAYFATLDLGLGAGPYGEAALIVAQDEVYVYTVAVINYYQTDNEDLNGVALEAAQATIEAMVATPAGLATPAASADDPPVSGTWAKFPAQADDIPQRYGITYAEDTLYLAPEAPVALPPGVASTYGTGEGLTAVVARSYGVPDAETGEPHEVPAAYVELAAYDSPTNAGTGFGVAGTAQLAELGLDDAGLAETAPDVTADAAVAQAGEVEAEGVQYSVAVVVAQAGPYVVTVVFVAGGDEDALTPAGELAQAVLDAAAGDGEESFNADGLSTGGVWDKLPAAGADVPRGLEPLGDEVYFPEPESDF